jgi:hypothetical protein
VRLQPFRRRRRRFLTKIDFFPAFFALLSLSSPTSSCTTIVIAYYSSTIFRQAGFDEISALGASLGFGALNWIFAAPAVYTIDSASLLCSSSSPSYTKATPSSPSLRSSYPPPQTFRPTLLPTTASSLLSPSSFPYCLRNDDNEASNCSQSASTYEQDIEEDEEAEEEEDNLLLSDEASWMDDNGRESLW